MKSTKADPSRPQSGKEATERLCRRACSRQSSSFSQRKRKSEKMQHTFSACLQLPKEEQLRIGAASYLNGWKETKNFHLFREIERKTIQFPKPHSSPHSQKDDLLLMLVMRCGEPLKAKPVRAVRQLVDPRKKKSPSNRLTQAPPPREGKDGFVRQPRATVQNCPRKRNNRRLATGPMKRMEKKEGVQSSVVCRNDIEEGAASTRLRSSNVTGWKEEKLSSGTTVLENTWELGGQKGE